MLPERVKIGIRLQQVLLNSHWDPKGSAVNVGRPSQRLCPNGQDARSLQLTISGGGHDFEKRYGDAAKKKELFERDLCISETLWARSCGGGHNFQPFSSQR